MKTHLLGGGLLFATIKLFKVTLKVLCSDAQDFFLFLSGLNYALSQLSIFGIFFYNLGGTNENILTPRKKILSGYFDTL